MPSVDSRQDEALSVIDCQLEALSNIPAPLSDTFPVWKSRTIRFLENRVHAEEVAAFSDISRSSWESEAKACKKFLQVLRDGIVRLPSEYLIRPSENEDLSAAPEETPSAGLSASKVRVFVIHGHNDVLKLELARMLERLGLEALVLHEQPNQGKTIIEKLERDAAGTTFAVALLSGDDVGYAKSKVDDAKPRARQNVVLELGYFSGLLGRTRVAVLYESGVEIPSDYLGVVYIPIDPAGSWKFSLAKELQAAGISIDLNKVV
jgi:predicted nucleotide-binding protein